MDNGQDPSLMMTDDGSHSLYNAALHEHYHSKYGALQESLFIYIEKGLQEVFKSGKDAVSVFEMGFGTGMNCYLTLINSVGRRIKYTAIDILPLKEELYSQLNYVECLGRQEDHNLFQLLHEAGWNQKTEIRPGFSLEKVKKDLIHFETERSYDLIYYDAFGPSAQPELWTLAIFQKLYEIMNIGGIITTYCSKGDVRRNMLSAGFMVEKLKGPPGKREILRARK